MNLAIDKKTNVNHRKTKKHKKCNFGPEIIKTTRRWSGGISAEVTILERCCPAAKELRVRAEGWPETRMRVPGSDSREPPLVGSQRTRLAVAETRGLSIRFATRDLMGDEK